MDAAVAVGWGVVIGLLLRCRPRGRWRDGHPPHLRSKPGTHNLPLDLAYQHLLLWHLLNRTSECMISDKSDHLAEDLSEDQDISSLCKVDLLGLPKIYTQETERSRASARLTLLVVVLSNRSLLHFVPMTTFSVSSHSCRHRRTYTSSNLQCYNWCKIE